MPTIIVRSDSGEEPIVALMSVLVLSRTPAFQPCGLAQFQGSSVERTGWDAARPLFPTQYHRADRSLINLI